MVLVGSLTLSAACQAGAEMLPPRQPLRVFCAGSLILPFAELEKAFEAANPDIDVQNECHGSIQVIRHVTDLHKEIDVVATADQALIPMLMYTANDPDSDQPYASWYIRFAGNRMALAYTPNSRYADEIQAGNWFEILTRPDVKFGLPDPRFDAAGYRALMVLSMAENEYSVQGLYNNLIRDSFTFPVMRFREAGRAEITVPEILEPAQGSKIILRGGSIQLLAVLESGDLDYAFEYESVIAQHKLLSIPLPDSINLGSAAGEDMYSQVQVKLDFQRFASVQPVFQGDLIGYGITIPSNAPQPELAARYVAFLLSQQGRAVMASTNHPLLTTIQCDQPDQIPYILQEYCPGE
jgi:molybdate/tungstate transport system substrate-binding protein